MWADIGRCGEVSGDVGSCGELWEELQEVLGGRHG